MAVGIAYRVHNAAQKLVTSMQKKKPREEDDLKLHLYIKNFITREQPNTIYTQTQPTANRIDRI